MRKTIKLGLLSAAASAFLALPVAASAETSSRGETLSTTPQIIEIIQQPIIFEHNPPGDLARSGDHNPPDDLTRSGDHNPPDDLTRSGEHNPPDDLTRSGDHNPPDDLTLPSASIIM